SHTPSGAQASAAIYSLIETARAYGLSPYEYLQFVFETLPTLGEDDDLGTLLPWCWKDTLPV
ncbi:transposase domain-containing protein, partial [Guyparkeria sp. 1SP6A2]|nr:transposase domain-containing protein [Guyparkeria sp. 1SP6A2]